MAARFAVALLIAGASRAESQTRPDVPTSFGRAVCWLGDRDGDGFSDFAISEPTAWNEDGTYGAVWIYSANDVRPRARLAADSRDLWFGAQIDSSADLDGDEVRDLIVLASAHAPFFCIGCFSSRNAVELHAYSGCTLEPLWRRTLELSDGEWTPKVQILSPAVAASRAATVLLTRTDGLVLLSGETGERIAELHSSGCDLLDTIVIDTRSAKPTVLALVSSLVNDRWLRSVVSFEPTSNELAMRRGFDIGNDVFVIRGATDWRDLVFYATYTTRTPSPTPTAVGALKTTNGETAWRIELPEDRARIPSLAVTSDLDGDGVEELVVGTHSPFSVRVHPTIVRSGRTGEILRWFVPPPATPPRIEFHAFFGSALCFAPRFRAADDAVVLVSDAGIGESSMRHESSVLVYSLRDGRCIWRIQRPD